MWAFAEPPTTLISGMERAITSRKSFPIWTISSGCLLRRIGLRIRTPEPSQNPLCVYITTREIVLKSLPAPIIRSLDGSRKRGADGRVLLRIPLSGPVDPSFVPVDFEQFEVIMRYVIQAKMLNPAPFGSVWIPVLNTPPGGENGFSPWFPTPTIFS